MSKDLLRNELQALRNSIVPDERAAADALICERVCALPAFQDADTVFSYLSFGAEIDTRAIIERAWRDGKTVALPRCVGPHEMRWFAVVDFDHLERSRFGVDEPPIDERTEVAPTGTAHAIALVPGLSFDARGYRLGYGGGFYDAFLPSFTGTSVGLCRQAQLSADPLPIDPHDIPVDIVVTD